MNNNEKTEPVNYVPNVKDLAELVHKHNTLSAKIHAEQQDLEELSKSISRYVNNLDKYYYGSSKKPETK